VNPYSVSKALCHGNRLAEMKAGGHPAPVHLQLIITNRCNHNCEFCAYRMEGYTSAQTFDERSELSTADAVDIMRSASEFGVRAVQFTGGGEPTVHRGLPALLAAAQSLGLKAALVTNGQLLRDELQTAVLGCAWIRVSLDAGSDQTYQKIRRVRPGVFDQVLTHVRELTARRRLTGAHVYVGLSFLVTEQSWQEIPIAVEIAESLGVDNLRFSAVFSPDDHAVYQGFGDEAAALCRKVSGARLNGLLVTDNFSDRLGDLRQGAPDYDRCHYQRLTTYIGADLNVYRCCLLAYNERGLLASLMGRTFESAWNDPATVASLAQLNPRECLRCQFNERNRSIGQLMEMIPDQHGDFI